MKRKNVVILGSTGSIGINTLKVVKRYREKFNVYGLTAYNNHTLLEKQIKEFNPKYVAATERAAQYLRKRINTRKTRILNVDGDLEGMVSQRGVDVVVIGMRGSAALEPFLAAARAGKTIAPANKEALVVAGDILMKAARQNGATIVPVDSEQSAIFQCLEGNRREDLKRVYLTASGGTLRDVPKAKFNKLSVKQMLKHPTWKMGDKITIDSATLMNKGFEVLEAQALFNLDIKDIEVLIHPQSIIHSMIEYKDGSIMAQLGVTDMRIPIQYALTYPERLDVGLKQIDFCKLAKLTFEKPDMKKFPSLGLCMYVGRKGGTLPSVLNAADEVAVEAYLNGKLKFTKIYDVVERIVRKHKIIKKPTLKQIIAADDWARSETRKVLDR